jgi:hypothetical protein
MPLIYLERIPIRYLSALARAMKLHDPTATDDGDWEKVGEEFYRLVTACAC